MLFASLKCKNKTNKYCNDDVKIYLSDTESKKQKERWETNTIRWQLVKGS